MIIKDLEATKAKFEQKIVFSIAVGAVIQFRNRILLVQAEEDDLWNFPGSEMETTQNLYDNLQHIVLSELKFTIPKPAEEKIFIFNYEIPAERPHTTFLLHQFFKLQNKPEIIIGNSIIDFEWRSIADNFNDCYLNVPAAIAHFTSA